MPIHASPRPSLPALSRRGFLGAGLGLAATAGLAACGGGSSDTGGAAASAGVTLPTYREFDKVTPDLPGNDQGLQAAFTSFPKEFVASTTGKPLTGTVTGLTETFATPSPGMKQNGFWQRLNGALGGDLDLIIGTDPGYPEKFATILASDDLPDLMWVPPNQGIPNVGPMLEAKFTDLTSQLSGDAVLEYPNLAALKPTSWKTAVVNGKIWGAPIPSTPFGQVMGGNPKLWENVGGFRFDSADDFLAKAQEISRDNVYALEPAIVNVLHMVGEWFGVPNAWRVNADRTLTRANETDQYRAALEFTAKLWKAGCMHPDLNLPDGRPLVAQGRIASWVSVGPKAVSELRDFAPDLQAEALVPFSADGTVEPVYDMGYGTVGFTAFKQADEGRVKELLSLINWLSAPFGTTEYVQKNFGTEGTDWTRSASGDIELSAKARTEVPGLASALSIMTSPETVIYTAGASADAPVVHSLEQELLKIAMFSPVRGLYSDTANKVGPKISQPVSDTVIDVVTGRRTMADFDAAIKRYNESGGDKIREEYQAVLPADVPVFGS